MAANPLPVAEEKRFAHDEAIAKCMNSFYHNLVKDLRKSKFEQMDGKSDESEKIKTATDTASGSSSTSPVDGSCETIVSEINETCNVEIRLKKKWLRKYSRRFCRQVLTEVYKEELEHLQNTNKELENRIKSLDEEIRYCTSKAAELACIQRDLFEKYQYNPETPTRTVGVNVKIFRECDFPQLAPNEVETTVQASECDFPQLAPNEVETTVQASDSHTSVPVTSVPLIKSQVPLQTKPISALTEIPPAQVQQIRRNVSSNETYGQLIDIIDEDRAEEKLLSASSNLLIASNSLSSNINLPGLQSNQNVLLPVTDVIQMLPASTQSNSQLSLRNPMQVQQMSQQTLIPTISSNRLGPSRTVAYIVPSNPRQISPIGQGSLPVSNFMPGTNHQLQTFVRVPNPGYFPLSTMSSNARMPILTALLQSPCKGLSSSPPTSELVCVRQPKHPAPFPTLPEYHSIPLLKALPPKPSLKGSRFPNGGVILSWNLNLTSSHADILDYQLFAYQEMPGPVTSSLWKKVGHVKALPLPMACTLTQFSDGNRYFFTVRAVDAHMRLGPYSNPIGIWFAAAKDIKSSNK